jgi:hypothetical protein
MPCVAVLYVRVCRTCRTLPTTLQVNGQSAPEILAYQRTLTVMDKNSAEVLQASAAIRRRRRRALVKALRVGKRATQVLLTKSAEVLSSLVSWDDELQ